MGFLSTLDSTHREMSNDGAKGDMPDDYLLKVDNPLVVPVNKKVRIITTANDVIHAWGVPAFGVKQDAIPGFVRDTWFRSEKIGDFYGQCYELCGKEHAYMPIHVKVLSAQDYTRLGRRRKEEDGRQAGRPDQGLGAGRHHRSAARRSTPPTARPATRPTARAPARSRPLDGSPIVLDADKSKQIQIVLNGRQRAPCRPGSSCRDTDIAAVISFTKNNWSNKTGQIVQPAEVLAQRGK